MVAEGIQAGLGVGQMLRGRKTERQADLDYKMARQQLGATRYANYGQGYYEELQRRESVGLPEEQKIALEQGANRSAAFGLQASEDRRAGLMGVGYATTSLADAYRNIGLADVAERNRRAEITLAEMQNRASTTYGEQRGLVGLDLAEARSRRQEGIAMNQAGQQNLVSGVEGAETEIQGVAMQAAGMGGGGGFGAQPSQGSSTGYYQPSYTPPPNIGYTPNYNPSLSENRSPFAYGYGLNYNPGMSGVSI